MHSLRPLRFKNDEVLLVLRNAVERRRLVAENRVDVIIEASGSVSAIEGAWKYLSKGGKVALIGLPSESVRVNLGPDVIFKEARIIGIHGREMFATWTKMEHMLERGLLRVDPVITHEMPLERFAESIELLEAGNGGKVILTP